MSFKIIQTEHLKQLVFSIVHYIQLSLYLSIWIIKIYAIADYYPRLNEKMWTQWIEKILEIIISFTDTTVNVVTNKMVQLRTEFIYEYPMLFETANLL